MCSHPETRLIIRLARSAALVGVALVGVPMLAQVRPTDETECKEPTRSVVLARAEGFLRDVAAVPDAARGLAPIGSVTGADVRVVRPWMVDDPRWGAAWEVKYRGGSVSLCLATDLGVVVELVDSWMVDTLAELPAPEPEEQIGADAALRRAVGYLRLARVPLDDVALETVYLSNISDRANGASRYYTVVLGRVWHGVRYSGQWINVTIDARYGRLLGFGVGLAAIPPVEAELRLLPGAAAEVARGMLSSLEPVMQPAGGSSVQLQVVLPNGIWPDWKTPRARSEMPTTLQARLAWVVETPTRNPGARAEVWVDAANGQILGGATKASMGRTKLPAEFLALQAAFASCRGLTVTRMSSKRPIPAHAAARRLGPDKTPLAFYGALAGLAPCPPNSPAPRFQPTHRLILVGREGRSMARDYDARSGIIGKGKKAIAQAGAALRQWVSPAPWTRATTGGSATPAR